MYFSMLAIFCFFGMFFETIFFARKLGNQDFSRGRDNFFDLQVWEEYEKFPEWKKSIVRQSCQKEYVDLIEDIRKEIQCFPVKNNTHCITFEDSWNESRSYGGNRTHEGVDLMYSQNRRGEVVIQSICDGVVERKGWLPLGGYRIGIRSDAGVYYYYAHMYSYWENIEVGARVKAGQELGTMGDSGYGEEGTVGKFPVHLHFGIYVPYENDDVSVNPYNVLCYLLKKEKISS